MAGGVGERPDVILVGDAARDGHERLGRARIRVHVRAELVKCDRGHVRGNHPEERTRLLRPRR